MGWIKGNKGNFVKNGGILLLSVVISLFLVEAFFRFFSFDFSHLPVKKLKTDSDWQVQRPLKILVIGDSQCVTDFSFPHLLAAKLPRNVEVIKMCESGCGPDHYLQFYSMAVRRYNPDMVVLSFYVGNDIINLLKFTEAPLKEKLKLYLGSTFETYHLARIAYSRIRYGIERTIFKAKVRKEEKPQAEYSGEDYVSEVNVLMLQDAKRYPAIYKENLAVSSKDIKKAYDVFDSIMRSFMNKLNRNKTPLILISIPDALQVNIKYHEFFRNIGFITDSDMLTSNAPQQRLSDLSKKYNFDFIDALPDFRKRDSEVLYYLNDGHLNRKGHRYLADLLLERLHQKGYVDGP